MEALWQDLLSTVGATATTPVGTTDRVVPQKGKRTKPLTDEERFSIVQMYSFFGKKENGKAPRGFRAKVAKHFGVSPKTINVVMNRWKADGDTKSRSKNAGRKKKYPDLVERFNKLPLEQRRTVRLAAEHLKVPRSVIHNRIQSGELIMKVNSSTA